MKPAPARQAGATTAELLVAAARRAIVTRGPGRLTISAVAAEAGVSRPTVYRWFPTKPLLLAAITAEEAEEFDAGLRAAVDAHRAPRPRLDAALRYLVTYHDGKGDPIGVDPAFARQSLADALAPAVAALAGLLGDALDVVPSVQSGAVTRGQAAEVILRVAYSHYLAPDHDAEAVLRLLRAFAGLEARKRVRPGS